MNDSREHILLTSLTLFLQKSFKEVTMKEIVDKTGLSKGAFYHYFSSKEQVFSEVINHFFQRMMHAGYDQLPQGSLKEFYQGILAQMEKGRAELSGLLPSIKDETFNHNFYFLIFDAMRMLPEFKTRHREDQKKELKVWKKVAGIARKSGEISTQMTDEQIARLFIYLGDGANINLIMREDSEQKNNELKSLWNGLYQTLKA